MERHRLLVLGALVVMCASCVTTEIEVTPLASFDIAQPAGEDEETHLDKLKRPRCILREQLQKLEIPQLVPYCTLKACRPDGYIEGTYRGAWWRAARLGADVVEIVPKPAKPVGGTMVSNHIGLGISLASAPPPIIECDAVLYRLPVSQFGFKYDPDTLIVLDVSAEACGILEGDRLLKVDGMDFTKDPATADYLRVLLRAPGTKIRLEWIRSGSGKMEGLLTLVAAPMTNMESIKDCVHWSPVYTDDE